MLISYDSLKKAAVEILISLGESPENAETAANCMLKSDAQGTVTHGTHLLNPILMRVKGDQLSLPTRLEIVSDTGATAIIDGGDGLGSVAGMKAAEIAVEKAKQYGISCVLIRNTNNIGTLACYTEYVASQGMIAIMSSNAAAAMAPWGAAEAFLGTNPIAIAIYTRGDCLVSADMATAIVARGKIRKAARDGTAIPDNWATDEDGNFTTDPVAALKGALLPMGGPKGSALAIAADIMSGILAGASHAPNLKSFHVLEGKTGVGASLIAIDIGKFMDLTDFANEMDNYIRTVKNLKKAPGVDEILMPGEDIYKMTRKSIIEGINLDENAVSALNKILKSIGSETHLGA